MAKKTLKKKAASKGNPVVNSARDIWLAGLGALSVAQKESGKVVAQGNHLFEKLVSEGSRLESSTRSAAGSAVEDIRGEVENRVGSVRKQAADNWDKLEKVFEDRVARALSRLGVPTADDIQVLADRVSDLADKVRAASGEAPARKSKPAAKKASKPAAKKATRKKTAKKASAKKAEKVASQLKQAAKEVKAQSAA